jgi:hypothetical protein
MRRIGNLNRGMIAWLAGVAIAVAGCAVPLDDVPGDDPGDEGAVNERGRGEPGGDEPATATTEQALVFNTACTPFQNHGGSFIETSFTSTLGCACQPGFSKDSFSVSHTGAGNCSPLGWASSDPHDCSVSVLITNSAFFLTGTCNAAIGERSDVCSHSVCSTGGSLFGACSPVATQICAADSFCCNNSWDSICVNEVRTIANSLACPGSCPHSACTTGGPLNTTCSTDVALVCGRDPFCCATQWDAICVGEVASVAGKNCGT